MFTISFLSKSFLKSYQQQSSQSSLAASASLLQGDTLSKQSNLLIPPVFIFQKLSEDENQTNAKEQQALAKFIANMDIDYWIKKHF